jgi:hypothetical protein
VLTSLTSSLSFPSNLSKAERHGQHSDLCHILHPFRFTILFGRINHEIFFFLLQALQQMLSYAADTQIILCTAKMKYHRPLNIVDCEFDDIFILRNRVVLIFSLKLLGSGLMCGI